MKKQEYFKRLRNVMLIALLALPPICSFAESLTNENGDVYDNVTVLSATPKDLLITYQSNGRRSAASIPLKSLPPEVQQRYGYAPGKEELYKADMARRDAANAPLLDQARQAPAETSSTPLVPHAAQAKDTEKSASASLTPTVDGGLTDEQIRELHSKYTDTSFGGNITYLFTASMSRAQPTAAEQKKYVESGKIPFTISVQLYQQIMGQKDAKQILDGSAHFYIFDSDGNLVVEPRTDSLLKLCRH